MKQIFLLCLMVCLPLVSNAQIMGFTSYDFTDGSVLPSDGSDQTSVTSNDNALVINQGTGGFFKFHDSTHGGIFNNGNSFNMLLSGNTVVNFTVCAYSAAGATLIFTDDLGVILGSIEAENNGGADGEIRSFSYEGVSQQVTATLVAAGSVYFHKVSINNIPSPIIGTTLYDFKDGSILPTSAVDLTDTTSADHILHLSQGSGNPFRFNDATHGGLFSNANTFTMVLGVNATVNFSVCTYSADGSTLVFTNESGTNLGSIEADNNGGDDGETRSFIYAGVEQIITATLNTTGSVYFHDISITNNDVVTANEVIAMPSVAHELECRVQANNNAFSVATTSSSNLQVQVYNMQGVRCINTAISGTTSFKINKGFWIVKVSDGLNSKIVKILIS